MSPVTLMLPQGTDNKALKESSSDEQVHFKETFEEESHNLIRVDESNTNTWDKIQTTNRKEYLLLKEKVLGLKEVFEKESSDRECPIKKLMELEKQLRECRKQFQKFEWVSSPDAYLERPPQAKSPDCPQCGGHRLNQDWSTVSSYESSEEMNQSENTGKYRKYTGVEQICVEYSSSSKSEFEKYSETSESKISIIQKEERNMNKAVKFKENEKSTVDGSGNKFKKKKTTKHPLNLIDKKEEDNKLVNMQKSNAVDQSKKDSSPPKQKEDQITAKAASVSKGQKKIVAKIKIQSTSQNRANATPLHSKPVSQPGKGATINNSTDKEKGLKRNLVSQTGESQKQQRGKEDGRTKLMKEKEQKQRKKIPTVNMEQSKENPCSLLEIKSLVSKGKLLEEKIKEPSGTKIVTKLDQKEKSTYKQEIHLPVKRPIMRQNKQESERLIHSKPEKHEFEQERGRTKTNPGKDIYQHREFEDLPGPSRDREGSPTRISPTGGKFRNKNKQHANLSKTSPQRLYMTRETTFKSRSSSESERTLNRANSKKEKYYPRSSEDERGPKRRNTKRRNKQHGKNKKTRSPEFERGICQSDEEPNRLRSPTNKKFTLNEDESTLKRRPPPAGQFVEPITIEIDGNQPHCSFNWKKTCEKDQNKIFLECQVPRYTNLQLNHRQQKKMSPNHYESHRKCVNLETCGESKYCYCRQ